MKQVLLFTRSVAVVFLLFLSVNAAAQLNPFTLTLTPVAQTCLGNGSITFAASGTTSGSTISYEVYLLPNVQVPVTTTSGLLASSLSAGNYRVIATQTLGNLTNTAQADTTVANNIVQLQFSVTGTNVTCNNDGRISIAVTAGLGAGYEIISGPVTRALQTSNVFSNLPPGIYRVRVFDACGEGFTRDVTLIQPTAQIAIDPPIFAGPLPNCTTIKVQNQYTSPADVGVIYPLFLTYMVFPPGNGAPVTFNTTIQSGLATDVALADIPFYYDQQYSYNLTIRDGCGNVFTRNNNIVYQKISLEIIDKYPGCAGVEFKLIPTNYMAPYTITFPQAPAGFNPAAAAPGHPVFEGQVTYGEFNPVPEGDYTIVLTDACGNSVTESFTLEYPLVSPQSDVNAACGSDIGSAAIGFEDREITQIIIQQAPAAYTGPLPEDLSAGITEYGAYYLSNVPQGDYVFYIVDSCGDTHTFPLTIAPTSGAVDLTAISRAGCEAGNGSLRLYGPLGTFFTGAAITAAPEGFTETLPYDITASLNGGQLYINGLPGGQYTIALTDQCNFVQEEVVTVLSYTVTANNVTIVPHCGSFDINLQHTSNGNFTQSFWLQKLINPATNQWGHPGTGMPYYDGNLPTAADSKILSVNQLNMNNEFTGHFRVIKIFYGFNNGNQVNQRCVETLKEFDFGGGPEIVSVDSFPCASGAVEAAVMVSGVPPFTYSIISRNGDAGFTVNNGANNVFTSLTAGTYVFQVTDDCNNVRNKEFTINAQQPVAITPSGFCEGESSSLSVPSYTFLSYQWYKVSNPSAILSTSAMLNFNSYTSATDAGVYAVRIISQDPDSCLNQTIQYTVDPNHQPQAGTDSSLIICNGAAGTVVNLAAQLGAVYDNGGVWADVDASGALTDNSFNTQGVATGTYRFTYTVNGPCGSADTATVTVAVNTIPQAPVVAPVAAVCEGATVQLTTTTTADAYNWTGPNGYTSSLQNPVLVNPVAAQSGTYTLTVTVNGCTSPATNVAVSIVPLPFAGNDAAPVQCNPGTVLDLFSYLGTGYTPGGTWTDVDASGALTGADFNTALVVSGNFRFRYFVTSPCGISDDATISITLHATPAAPVVTPLPLVCEGSAVQLTAAAVADPTAVYTWTGPNGYTSSLQSPTLSNVLVSQSGAYQVTVTTNGCTSPPAVVNLTVSPLPNAGNDALNTICNTGATIGLLPYLGTHDAGGTWTDVDASGALAGTDFTTAGVPAGTYRFRYTVTSPCGAVDTATISITLNDIPAAPVVTAITPVCAGDTIQLYATPVSIPGVSYSWTGPNGFTSAVRNPEITAATPANSGTYTLSLVTTTGCTTTPVSVVVTVKELPDYSVTGDAVLCAGQSTTLEVVPVNFSLTDASFSYTWYNGSIPLAETGSTLLVTDFGNYSVAVSNGTCGVMMPFGVSINTDPFEVEPIAGCENDRYIIRVANYADIANIASVSWTGPNGFTANGEWVDITGEPAGAYVATVTQQGGCVASAPVTVNSTFCNIPRGISPGDGKDNESFDLSNLDVRHIKIFNRYGMEVYEKYGYKNEWHGQSDKGDLPTGTYFYVVTLSQGKQVTGWVYLLRRV